MSTGLFLAEGEDLVSEALSAAILPVETFISSDRPPPEGLVARLSRGGPVHSLTDTVMADLSEMGHPSRVIAVFSADALPALPETSSVAVYLHQMSRPRQRGYGDPGGRGASAARSCGCRRVAPIRSPARRVRASMGAVFGVRSRSGRRLAHDRPPAGVDDIGRDADLGRESEHNRSRWWWEPSATVFPTTSWRL